MTVPGISSPLESAGRAMRALVRADLDSVEQELAQLQRMCRTSQAPDAHGSERLELLDAVAGGLRASLAGAAQGQAARLDAFSAQFRLLLHALKSAELPQ